MLRDFSLCVLVLAILLPAATPAASATSAQLDQARVEGLAWLLPKQHGDGSWQSSPGLAIQTTAHGLGALVSAGIDSGYSLSGAVSFLGNAEAYSADSLARQIEALSTVGAAVDDRVARLLLMRDDRVFAWGAYDGYQASLPDTPLALDALLLSDASYPDTGTSLGFLVNRQNPDGGWPYVSGAAAAVQSRVIPTAHAVLTLSRYRQLGWGVDDGITSGVSWLVSQAQPGGGHAEEPSATAGSPYETALVILAIQEGQAAGNPTAIGAQPTIDAGLDLLVNTQLPDGSWEGSALPTALTLRSLPPTTMVDSDGDGVPDEVELVLGSDPGTPDARNLAQGNGDAVPGESTALVLAAAAAGQAYSETLADTGGSGPYSWQLIAGVLPEGITLDGSTGELSGTPEAIGVFNFAYEVSDESGRSQQVVAQIVVTGAAQAVPALSPLGIGVLVVILPIAATLAGRNGGRGARRRLPSERVRRALRLLVGGLALILVAPAGSPWAAPRDRAPLPDDVLQRLVGDRVEAPDGQGVAPRLHEYLRETRQLLLELDEMGDRPDLPGPDRRRAIRSRRSLVEAQRAELEILRDEVRRRVDESRSRLGRVDAGGSQRARLDAALDRIEGRFDEVDAALSALGKLRRPAEHRAAAHSALALLSELAAEEHRTEGFGDRTITSFTASEVGPARSIPASDQLPAYLTDPVPVPARSTLLPATSGLPPILPPEAAACAYTAADVADDGREIEITPEIQTLAKELEYSAARIYEYVANEIAFEPHFGSLKGSVGTLYARRGGGTDQASLLIALLRASNVPARFVRGTIDVLDASDRGADGRAARWLGTKRAAAAAAVLAQSQNPGAGSFTGNVGIRLEHVWVEACVPYSHYRGTGLDDAGFRWIPLDASFEDRTYQSGITTGVSFDYANFLVARSNTLPHEAFEEQVEVVARALDPNTNLNDVPYAGELRRQRLDILPASLPYEVFAFTNWSNTGTPDTAVLPESHRYQLHVSVADDVGGSLLPRSTLAYPDSLHARVTLSFEGATPGDQTALEAWQDDGDPESAVPCGTINVVPTLRVEGSALASGGDPVDLCATGLQLEMSVTLEEGRASTARCVSNPGTVTVNDVCFSNIKAADYHSLQAWAFQGSDRLLAERAERLIAAVRANPDPNDALEETEGEFLHLVGLKYMRHISDAGRRIGQLDGGSGDSGHHLGLTSTQRKVEYVFDIPFAVRRAGWLVDVPGGRSRSVDLAIGSLVFDTFLLSGYSSSAFESFVWQESANLDAVSTVRGVQFANEQGIEVLTLDSSNWLAESPKLTSNPDPSLDYSAAQVNQIKTQYIDLGFTVTAPRSLIEYENWIGAVFVAALDNLPTSAQAGFIISGGYSGGFSVSTPPPGTDFSFQDNTLSNTRGITPSVTSGGDPVNMVNGNLYHTERDISIPGRGGLPFVFERFYNSGDPLDGPLGFGWTHSFNHTLSFEDDDFDGVDEPSDTDGLTSTVRWVDGTGASRFFGVAGGAEGIPVGATFVNQPSVRVLAAREPDGRYAMTKKNGLVYHFEPVAGTVGQQARLLSLADRNGNALTLSYDASGLDAVTDDVGRALDVTNGEGRIERIEDWTGRVWEYEYDAAGDLVIFRNPLAVAGAQPPLSYAYYSGLDGAKLEHRLRSYTLPRGNGMTFEYFANGKVFRHTNTLGETITFGYNDFRRESMTVDGRGETRRHFFDEYGNQIKLVEETGATRRYTYDPDPARIHDRLSRIDPMGLVTQFDYDALGNVTRITSPSGATLEFSDFNAFNLPGKRKDENGNYTISQYDPAGNLTDVFHLKQGLGAAVDPATYVPAPADLVRWVVHTYDAYGNRLSTRQVRDFATGEGPTTSFTFDAEGLYPLSVERCGDLDGDGSVSDDPCDIEDLIYDDLGRLERGIRSDWEIVEYQYDALGRITAGSDGFGVLRSYDYDDNGNQVRDELVVEDGGTPVLVDQYAAVFDLSDRLVAEIDSSGAVTRYDHDASGNLVGMTDPDNYTLRYLVDGSGRVVSTWNKEGQATFFDLDDAGRPVMITDANGNTAVFEYYAASGDGRLFRQYDGLGRMTEFAYDARGNVTRLTDNAGRSTLTRYDELDRPVRTVQPAFTGTLGLVHPVRRHHYDALGNLVRIEAGYTTDPDTPSTDIVSPRSIYTYDDHGRRLSESDGNSRVWRFQVDVHGNVVRIEDPKGQEITRSFLYGGRVEQETVKSSPSDPAPRITNYTRNPLGQATRVVGPEVTTDYRYDAAHRLATVTDGRGAKSIRFEYSPGGMLDRVIDDEGNRTDYLYDPVGRLIGIWAPNGDFVAYTYDAGGRPIEKWLSSGLNTHYTWNPDDTLAQVKNRLGYSDADVLTQHDYTYDALANRETHLERVGATTTRYRYVYDELNRLAAVRDDATDTLIEAYGYDPLGNRESRTDGVTTWYYGYDGADQLETIRTGDPMSGPLTAGFVYDANGNLASKCTGTSVTRTPSACTGSTRLDLQYDALDHLVQADRTGLPSESYAYDDQGRRIRRSRGGATSEYLYMGRDIHAEYVAGWASASAIFSHRPRQDDPLIRDAAGIASYYHQDGLGSVVARSDSQGTVLGTQRFDAWGRVLSATGSVPQYGYTGREPDATGLVYYRARYYDPDVGRFVQRDPLGFIDGVNRYTYVSNNPVNAVDPQGLVLDVFLDIGFIVFDVGVLGYDLIANDGRNWKIHTGALAADVAGAFIPFATGGGAAYRAGNRLVDVANQADNLVPPGGRASTRGTKIHTQFDNLIRSGGAGRNVSPETAYVRGKWQKQYRPEGSSNPDAVLGKLDKPTATFDLKTGKSGISDAQMTKYQQNLPDGTPVYTVRPTGHDVPRPQSLAGAGAGFNAGYLAGDALYGDPSPYSSGGYDSYVDPSSGK